MPTFEGNVLRVYRLPIVVEAADREAARRAIEDIYREIRANYDGAQDVFVGDLETPSAEWPIREIEEDVHDTISWSSWSI